MPAPFLFSDIRGGAGTVTLYRYQGATPSQVGNTFGTQWTAVTSQTALNFGACQYKGNLYALAQDGVYVKDDPTVNAGTWTQALAFTNPVVAKPRTSGLHIVYISDEPVLVVVFGDNTGDTSWRWAKFDGSTWTQASGVVVSAGIGEMHAVTVFRNVIHMIGSSGTGSVAMTFGPGSESFATITEPFDTSQYAHVMCVFDDRLFGIHNVSNVCRVVEYSGGSWVDVPGAVGLAVKTADYTGKWALWTDGTYLYGMMPSATNDGWRVLQWDSSMGAPTNLTATVLPSSLRSALDGGTFGGSTTDGVIHACGDQDSDPAVGDVWIFQADGVSAGIPYTLWKWNGPASLVTQVDSGGDVVHAVPIGMLQGGQYIWTAGEMDIWISGKAPIVGGERLKFRASGAAGVADKTVSFRYDDKNEQPLLLGTLSAVGVLSGAPAGAPSLGTNVVLNVDADPTVEYYADWTLTADGFTSSDRAQLKPTISV